MNRGSVNSNDGFGLITCVDHGTRTFVTERDFRWSLELVYFLSATTVGVAFRDPVHVQAQVVSSGVSSGPTGFEMTVEAFCEIRCHIGRPRFNVSV